MAMTDRERFLAVAQFAQPDYYPIFGNFGAPGFSGGAQKIAHAKLVREGMPARVGGIWNGTDIEGLDSWQAYWGVTSPLRNTLFPADHAGKPIAYTMHMEDGYEVLEYETGALTRQVVNNEDEYSMPDFVRAHVRDRASWEIYREKRRPGPLWDMKRIREACRPLMHRTRPLSIACGSTWGFLRDVAGNELAATMLYDDPELAHEIIDFHCDKQKKYMYPLIEILKPEIVTTGEDMCYNKGMLISPAHFREFCAPFYRETAELCRSVGVCLREVDNDGAVAELVSELDACGFNGLYPCECKAGNDLFALRDRFPRFVFMGWLEKEVVNDGNGNLIEPEIMGKVPRLLKTGGYFPNGDHGIQPLIGFKGLCRFMTLLHEVTGNPEGEFPRVWA
jgi:hypothetical protein